MFLQLDACGCWTLGIICLLMAWESKNEKLIKDLAFFVIFYTLLFFFLLISFSVLVCINIWFGHSRSVFCASKKNLTSFQQEECSTSCFMEEGPHAIGICGKGLRRKCMGSNSKLTMTYCRAHTYLISQDSSSQYPTLLSMISKVI